MHWLDPKYPILKLFFKMGWFNPKFNALWKFGNVGHIFNVNCQCALHVNNACMSKFQVLAFKDSKFAQSFFIVEKKELKFNNYYFITYCIYNQNIRVKVLYFHSNLKNILEVKKKICLHVMVSSDLYSVLGQANSAEDEQRLASIFPPYSFKYAQFPEIKKTYIC